MQQTRFHIFWVLLLAFCLHGLVMICIDDWQLRLLVAPAAKFAGLFLGLPSIAMSDFYLLPHSDLAVRVGLDCSGVNFYTMLQILTIYALLRLTNFQNFSCLRKLGHYLLWSLACYALCILINSLRIVAATMARLYSSDLGLSLPHEGVHFVIGGSLFLGAGLLYYWLLTSGQERSGSEFTITKTVGHAGEGKRIAAQGQAADSCSTISSKIS